LRLLQLEFLILNSCFSIRNDRRIIVSGMLRHAVVAGVFVAALASEIRAQGAAPKVVKVTDGLYNDAQAARAVSPTLRGSPSAMPPTSAVASTPARSLASASS
jgi:hypothetical protein